MITNAQAIDGLTSASKAISKVAGSFGRSLNKATIEDLKQGAIIKAIECFDPTRGVFGAIAYRAGLTVATDYLRGRTYAGGSNEASLGDMGREDDEGNVTALDVAEATPSALDLMLAGEVTTQLADAYELLSPSEREALRVNALDERALTGSERIAKMRAVKTIQSMVVRRKKAA